MPNNKENVLYSILEIVVSCCTTNVGNGKVSVSKDDILGRCRKENVILTREIVAGQIKTAGFTVSTIAELLGRTEHQVRKMLESYYNNVRTNRIYRIADAQATIKCNELLGGII